MFKRYNDHSAIIFFYDSAVRKLSLGVFKRYWQRLLLIKQAENLYVLFNFLFCHSLFDLFTWNIFFGSLNHDENIIFFNIVYHQAIHDCNSLEGRTETPVFHCLQLRYFGILWYFFPNKLVIILGFFYILKLMSSSLGE